MRTTNSLSSSLFACISGGEREEERPSYLGYSPGKSRGPAVYNPSEPAPPLMVGPSWASPREELPKVKEPTDADMLIAYATTPNHVSWRNR